MTNKLDTLYSKSPKIKINDQTKIVIMSDCHRGAGNNYDNFVKNKNIYKAALNYYDKQQFTYIELGDGDDMWEVKNYQDIIEEHIDSFLLLKKFKEKNKLYMIYGNHDKCKKNPNILKDYFYTYYNKETKQKEDLLNNLEVYESLVLEYKNKSLFLIHGHQVDFLNNNLWLLSRFLVRNVWRNLEKIGIKDPTSAAKNYRVTKKTEKKLKKWSTKKNIILVAGHTHRAIFPEKGESLYFNDGSCVHPDGITCLEIENGHITLVKWEYQVKENNAIFVGKKILEESTPLENFYLF